MFFLADCRYNLEANLGNDGGEKMYISTDSKCADALLGGCGFSANSKADKWNCYIQYGNIHQENAATCIRMTFRV